METERTAQWASLRGQLDWLSFYSRLVEWWLRYRRGSWHKQPIRNAHPMSPVPKPVDAPIQAQSKS